ncbi:MAG: PilZ domain-containing protein [Thermoanaerobaculia bacterium]|nr:PilZ domain-containing protein [Thermoanaerobaculia bacterium]
MSREPGSSDGSSLRRAPRAQLELEVRLEFDTGKKLGPAITADVSASGMYVQTLDPPPVGALVRFELDLPRRREPIRGHGEVAWIRVRPEGPDRPPGVGIRFRALDPEGRQALERAVLVRLGERGQGAEPAWDSPPPRPPRPPAPRPAARPAAPPPSSREIEAPRRSDRSAGGGRREGTGPESGKPAGASPRQLAILLALLLVLLLLLVRAL